MKRLALVLTVAAAHAQMFQLTREQMLHYTPHNPYERFEDGRPKVPESVLREVEKLSVPAVVRALDAAGYPNQFVGSLQALKVGQKLVGRAFTAQYIPLRPDLEKILVEDSEKRGKPARTNNKVIDELQTDDVPVIDLMSSKPGNNFGGDNLHAAIAGATKRGAVIWGTIRDIDGIIELPEQVFFMRGHPAAVASVSVLGMNIPVHIGPAVVMPGDVVLGDRTGVVFIPPHLLDKVLGTAKGAAPTADSRNVNTPDTNTHFTMPQYRTLGEWEARKKQLKQQILFSAGLDPMPEKTKMRAEVFGKLERDGYTIEKVLLETRPGYWLGGNLYKPRGKSGKLPAIVTPHGHWTYGRLEHQPLGSIPARCINLARQGYVVLAYDMVGYNDTVQTPHSFNGKREDLWGFGPLGLQLWNSIRVVDFLESLPEVDKDRIGATGASGGGTQTFLLTAVDDRIKAAAPVNMISAIMQGGSYCENTPGLRVGAFNVEIGAMTAPRPLLMVSATGDWTRNTMREEYPAMQGIFELYDQRVKVEAVQFDAPHNYNKDSREAMYKFFAKHLLGASNWETYVEKPVQVEQPQDMLALHGRRLPDGALEYEGVFAQWRQIEGKLLEGVKGIEERRRLLVAALGTEWPKAVEHQAAGETVVLWRPEVRDRIAGIWIPGQGQPVLGVHADGAAAARSLPEVQKALAAKRPVLLIDAFQTGKAVAARDRDKRHFLTFNRSDDALRVQDIVTAMRWLDSQAPGTGVELVGSGKAAIWARFAAAVSPAKVKLNAPAPAGFQGTDEELARDFFVPHVARVGGWKTAMVLTSGR